LQNRTYFTADLDDALAVAADFNDAVALERRETIATKKMVQIWISQPQPQP
jgi:hypothetical protein